MRAGSYRIVSSAARLGTGLAVALGLIVVLRGFKALVGHFGCSDQLTCLVVWHADPLGGFADAETVADQSSQGFGQPYLSLLA